MPLRIALIFLGLFAIVRTGLAETVRERGAYLVNTLAACANCHTSRTPPGPALAGGIKFGNGPTEIYAPNITPDPETGIGGWSDQQIASAIHNGIAPDGSHLRPPMPQYAYRAMSDEDVAAIVVYLRAVPPVRNRVPKTPVLMPAPSMSPVEKSPVLLRDSPIARGRYIATALAHCAECHTLAPLYTPEATKHFDEGGRVFQTSRGPITAPSITAKALSHYTGNELISIITTGVLPGGRRIEGPMPVKAYAGMSKTDLSDLIAFLRDPTPETGN